MTHVPLEGRKQRKKQIMFKRVGVYELHPFRTYTGLPLRFINKCVIMNEIQH